MGERRYVNRKWNLLVNVLAASPFLTGHVRNRFYRRGGIDPNGTQIRPGVWFFGDKITFGTEGVIERGVSFENREPITIGRRVFIGPRTYIATSTHQVGPSDGRAGAYSGAPTTIEDGCWIGIGVTILPGVTVARGCIIAAGAVVTSSTEPDGLYAGVPAVRKRDLV